MSNKLSRRQLFKLIVRRNSNGIDPLLEKYRRKVYNGRRYVDGGLRSGVSVDLADAAARLVIIAPLAGAMFGPFGSFVERKMRREMNEWIAKYSGRILLFAPKESTSHIATLPQHLFNREKALAAYEHGLNEATNAIL